MKAPVVCFSHRFPEPPSLPPRSPPPLCPHAELLRGKKLQKLKHQLFSVGAMSWRGFGSSPPPKLARGPAPRGKHHRPLPCAGDTTRREGTCLLFWQLGKKKAESAGTEGVLVGNTPKLPSAARAPAHPAARRGCCSQGGNPLGTVWGRATRTSREFKALIRDERGGNLACLF